MAWHISHKWVVFVAAVSVAFFDYGIAASLGGLYIAMLDTFNAGRAKTAFVQSLLFAFCLGFGVISGFLISKWGIKVLAYSGAVLTGAGFILSYFAVSIYQLYGFISVLIGAGSATMYIIAVLSVERSFSGKQNSIAVSLQSIGTAISGFVYPSLFSASLKSYSLRGTFLILGGLFLNNFAFAIVFAEAEQKTKAKENALKEHCYINATIESTTEMSDVTLEAELTNNPDLKVECCEIITDVLDEEFVNKVEGCKINNLMENDRKRNIEKEGHLEYNISKRINVHTDNGVKEESRPDVICNSKVDRSHSGNTEVRTSFIKNSSGLNNKTRCLRSLLCVYLTYTLASVLQMSTICGFLTLYQDLNVSNGLSIAQSDLTYMVYSLFNILSRFLPIIPAQVQNIHNFTIPIIASLCGVASQIILLCATPSIWTTSVAMAFCGTADGGWIASMQVIIFEIVPFEKHAVGFGFVLTSMGVVAAATGPLFGLSRDDSASYQTVLIATTVLFSASALLGFVCLVHLTRRRSKE